jgi:hypothetical protein
MPGKGRQIMKRIYRLQIVRSNNRGQQYQFIITGAIATVPFKTKGKQAMLRTSGTMFQSYKSNIVFITDNKLRPKTYLDSTYWNYSATTSKYRNQFLNESTAEIKAKIKSGEYTLTNLNGGN